MARFTVTFTEAGKAAEPDAVQNTSWPVEQRADSARAASLNDFLSKFKVSGPEFLRSNALGQATGVGLRTAQRGSIATPGPDSA
jgi:hypothetical protein